MEPDEPCYHCGHDRSEHEPGRCLGEYSVIMGPDNMDIEAHECDCGGFLLDDFPQEKSSPVQQDARPQLKVYVLWWRYYDGSGTGIARVYSDKSRAEDVLALLSESSDREWKIDEVQVDGPKE